jgi:hypothetical protein
MILAALCGIALGCSRAGTIAPSDPATPSSSESTDSTRGIFDSNPDHLWNRVYAAFYIREMEYGDSVPASHPLHSFYPKLLGPDVVDPPLGVHPRFLLDGGTFTTCRSVLDEFIEKRGDALISEPLKRAVLQRDLWAVFDVLQGSLKPNFSSSESTAPKLTAAQEEHRAYLARQLVSAIKALALSRDELARLPNTYLLATKSGAFSSSPVDQKKADYLPSDLEDEDSPWKEIFPPEKGPRAKEGFVHTELVRGRSVFRVFARSTAKPEGAKPFAEWLERMKTALETRLPDFYANGEEYRRWERTMREVPPGSQFLLLRRMVCLDPGMHPVPTHVVESIQIRIDRPNGNQNPAHIFEEFDLDRHLLFSNRQGGLRSLKEGTLHHFAYAGLGQLSTNQKGQVFRLGEFPRICIDCHGTLNPRGVAFPVVMSFTFPGQPGRQDGEKVGRRTTQWKMEQDEYKRLLEMTATRPR